MISVTVFPTIIKVHAGSRVHLLNPVPYLPENLEFSLILQEKKIFEIEVIN